MRQYPSIVLTDIEFEPVDRFLRHVFEGERPKRCGLFSESGNPRITDGFRKATFSSVTYLALINHRTILLLLTALSRGTGRWPLHFGIDDEEAGAILIVADNELVAMPFQEGILSLNSAQSPMTPTEFAESLQPLESHRIRHLEAFEFLYGPTAQNRAITDELKQSLDQVADRSDLGTRDSFELNPLKLLGSSDGG